MNLAIKQDRTLSQPVLRLVGLVMPYFTIWLGLYVLRNAFAAILGYHLGILLLVSIARAWVPPARFMPTKPAWKVLTFGMTGCLAGLVLLVLMPILDVSPALRPALLDWGLNSRTWLPFIAYSTVINPWLEEIHWRHWLGSPDTHPVVTDAAFAGFHLIILAPFFSPFWLMVAFIILASSGWMWRQVNRRENSMLASTLFHMCADVSILVVIWSTVGS